MRVPSIGIIKTRRHRRSQHKDAWPIWGAEFWPVVPAEGEAEVGEQVQQR